ncbi:Transposase family Tnp2 protein [Ceratobasidium sp. AG-Ba]|nr:Transposase family Tnp2 protein [Ceratobasidium sp. AG-Ba]
MDVDDEPPPNKRQICHCCGKLLGARQRARHRARIFAGFQGPDELDRGDGNSDNNDSDGNNIDGIGAGSDNAVESDEEPGNGVDVEMNLDNAGLAWDDGDDGLVNEGAALYAGEPEDPEPAHGVRRNPPLLHIHDWPDQGSEHGSEDEDAHFNPPEPIDGNPDDEHPPPGHANFEANEDIDPFYEFEMGPAGIRAAMEEQLGDLAEQELVELYDARLRERDINMLKFLAIHLRTGLSRQTWDELRFGPCEALGLPSSYVAHHRLGYLSEIKISAFDCCVNVCICFLGKYADADVCPYCKEPRRHPSGRPRRLFHYTPLIPQLQALFWSREMIEQLSYRVTAEELYDPNVYEDVFDGEHYRSLRNTRVNPNSDYCFFDNPEDLALGVSTDGFSMFKRRRRGFSTAWPIIVFNYNLHPRYRTRLENIICVGVIPGPKQCKDLNSFLVPLLDELLVLQEGVESVKLPPQVGPEYEGMGVQFILRAFMLLLIGDIPAVTKMLALKGHNGKSPCRSCYIQGIPYRYPRTTVYYTPLTRPGAAQGLPPALLLPRDHNLFLEHYRLLEELDGPRRAALAQDLGINSRPIFARLKSIDLGTCAPYDLMHLFFENLVPNMIAHWTGKFKQLDQGTGNYELAAGLWDEIGELTAQAGALIPYRFVGTLPDIAKDQNLYKAEAYSFWWQYLGPILLKDRLNQPYYDHYLLSREIVLRSVKLSITREEVGELEEMVVRWVTEYERYYYQHDYERLRACPLTIHALLHIVHYIRHIGPPCYSWAFGTERFCGLVLRAVKNRLQPGEQIDNWVLRRAQMQAVCFKHGLPRPGRSTVKWRYEGGERLSEHEFMHPAFNNIILGLPVRRNVQADRRLKGLLFRYFRVPYAGRQFTPEDLRARIDLDTLVSYGRFRMADDGDRIRTVSAVDTAKRSRMGARDNSFVRLTLVPDENASDILGSDVPIEVVYYSRLMNIYYIEFIEDIENDIRKPFLLARVELCKDTNGVDATDPETPSVTYRRLDSDDLFHIATIEAVVGRVKINNSEWAIVDCSRDGARTDFRDEEGEDLDDN